MKARFFLIALLSMLVNEDSLAKPLKSFYLVSGQMISKQSKLPIRNAQFIVNGMDSIITDDNGFYEYKVWVHILEPPHLFSRKAYKKQMLYYNPEAIVFAYNEDKQMIKNYYESIYAITDAKVELHRDFYW
jgi:hypothetical protein